MITAVQYFRAQRVKTVFLREMEKFFRSMDLFVTPGRPAPAGEPANVPQEFARMFNCSGYPAMAVPAGFSSSPSGLPVGIQIAAAPFEEEKIYTAAQAYESGTRWYERRPKLD